MDRRRKIMWACNTKIDISVFIVIGSKFFFFVKTSFYILTFQPFSHCGKNGGARHASWRAFTWLWYKSSTLPEWKMGLCEVSFTMRFRNSNGIARIVLGLWVLYLPTCFNCSPFSWIIQIAAPPRGTNSSSYIGKWIFRLPRFETFPSLKKGEGPYSLHISPQWIVGVGFMSRKGNYLFTTIWTFSLFSEGRIKWFSPGKTIIRKERKIEMNPHHKTIKKYMIMRHEDYLYEFLQMLFIL